LCYTTRLWGRDQMQPQRRVPNRNSAGKDEGMVSPQMGESGALDALESGITLDTFTFLVGHV